MVSIGVKGITIDQLDIIHEDAVEEIIEVEDEAGVAVVVSDTDTITSIQIILRTVHK